MAEQTLVSVDLDDIACYHAIHGLHPPPHGHRGVVLERCLPRFLELFGALGVKATFFVIGRDLREDAQRGGHGAALLRDALADGHELANHSHAHAYDLVSWSDTEIRADIEACDAALRELGAEPVGFRAPGYTRSAAMLEQVRACGYAYDSSSLPSPLYYAAKVAVIAALALRGRASTSVATGAASFLGPRTPHAHRSGLRELPISVSPRLRIPLIGTFLLSGPRLLAPRLREVARALPHFHLELHGLDLADPDADGYAANLVATQPELQRALPDKRDALEQLLRARGRTTLLRDA